MPTIREPGSDMTMLRASRLRYEVKYIIIVPVTNIYMVRLFNAVHTLQIQWLKQSGFGGAMVWSLDLDDFSGTFCGQGKYPLINTIKSGLGTGACMYNTHILW